MPEGWGIFAVAKYFGIPLVVLSYLTAWNFRLLEISFETIPNPYKNVMYFMTCVFMAFWAYDKYQTGRRKKIENDQLEWENMEKRKPKQNRNLQSKS